MWPFRRKIPYCGPRTLREKADAFTRLLNTVAELSPLRHGDPFNGMHPSGRFSRYRRWMLDDVDGRRSEWGPLDPPQRLPLDALNKYGTALARLHQQRKELQAKYHAMAERLYTTKESNMMPVIYTHTHHTDGRPCEHRPIIPDGYEAIDSFAVKSTEGVLAARDGFWVLEGPRFGVADAFIRRKPAITLEVGAWYEVEGGGVWRAEMGTPTWPDKHPLYLLGSMRYYEDGTCWSPGHSPRILRRMYVSESASTVAEPEPFRLTGPGWYRTGSKKFSGWVKLVERDFIHQDWNSDGTPRMVGQQRIVARATPEQERVLEGL